MTLVWPMQLGSEFWVSPLLRKGTRSPHQAENDGKCDFARPHLFPFSKENHGEMYKKCPFRGLLGPGPSRSQFRDGFTNGPRRSGLIPRTKDVRSKTRYELSPAACACRGKYPWVAQVETLLKPELQAGWEALKSAVSAGAGRRGLGAPGESRGGGLGRPGRLGLWSHFEGFSDFSAQPLKECLFAV